MQFDFNSDMISRLPDDDVQIISEKHRAVQCESLIEIFMRLGEILNCKNAENVRFLPFSVVLSRI